MRQILMIYIMAFGGLSGLRAFPKLLDAPVPLFLVTAAGVAWCFWSMIVWFDDMLQPKPQPCFPVYQAIMRNDGMFYESITAGKFVICSDFIYAILGATPYLIVLRWSEQKLHGAVKLYISPENSRGERTARGWVFTTWESGLMPSAVAALRHYYPFKRELTLYVSAKESAGHLNACNNFHT